MARLKPDVVVVKSDSAVRDVLEHIVMATRDAPRPIVMFTDDPDRPTMRSALGAGVSAYVVKGLKPDRAQAREHPRARPGHHRPELRHARRHSAG